MHGYRDSAETSTLYQQLIQPSTRLGLHEAGMKRKLSRVGEKKDMWLAGISSDPRSKKGMCNMLSGPNFVTSLNTPIFAIAGYYTDYDGMQHVIAAAKDGNVYQVGWISSELEPYHPPADKLGHFDNITTIAGFFTPDDNYHHAVASTGDGKLHELWFKPGESPHKTDLPYNISGFHASKGMASFYSPCDNLRHVVLVDRNGRPVDITWKANSPTNGVPIAVPPTDSQIASLSGFLSRDENPNNRHIIVARNDTGQIYDIAYPDENHVDQNCIMTSFHEPVQNVTAFFSSDTNYRHIVVLTQVNFLKDLAYPPSYVSGGALGGTQLTSSALANVADITSFYTPHDRLRHVVYATRDGNLYEITYMSQG